MLSRRLIRTKTLQILFSNEIGKDISPVKLEKQLLKSIQDGKKLYYTYLAYLIEMSHYSIIFAQKQEQKLLKENAKKASIILSQNRIVQSISQSQEYRDFIAFHKIHELVNQKIVKKLFEQLSEKEKYKNYIDGRNPSATEDLEMLRYIVKKIIGSSFELEEDLLEYYNNIDADNYSILMSIQKTLKTYSESNEDVFLQQILLSTDQSELQKFGTQLIDKYTDHSEDLENIIKPNLTNWDFDRVAIIDICILKMAICEFKYFGNIPPKVTLNEYLDIANEYSSEKSKEFINGILDKIMKSLNEKGEIKKYGRGLIN